MMIVTTVRLDASRQVSPVSAIGHRFPVTVAIYAPRTSRDRGDVCTHVNAARASRDRDAGGDAGSSA